MDRMKEDDVVECSKALNWKLSGKKTLYLTNTQQIIQSFKILLYVLCSTFSRLEFSVSVIFSLHIMNNIFFLPDWHTSAVMCLHKCKSMCKDVSPILQMNKAHHPWNIPKETGRTLTWWIPIVSWIQRIISTQATERNSGVMRLFQDGCFLLCWVSTSFHHFSAAATIGKRRKKRKQLSGDICPYVVLIFVLTLLYSTL